MKLFIFGLALLALLGTGFAEGGVPEPEDDGPCSPEALCKPEDHISLAPQQRCFFVTYPNGIEEDAHAIFDTPCDKKIHACEYTQGEEEPTFDFITEQNDQCDKLEKEVERLIASRQA